MVQGVQVFERLSVTDQTLTMGSLATLAKVNRETIRFYERNGLLTAVSRSAGGYRQFGEEDVKRLLFIRRARQLGFTLQDIKELLKLADGRISSCASVRELANRRLESIATQMKQLTVLANTLRKHVRKCNRTTVAGQCPIIDSLSGEDGNEDD